MKLGILGCGKMGGAILNSIEKKGLLNNSDISVFELNNRVIDELKHKGYSISASESELLNKCEIVIFAIKPQEINSVIQKIGKKVNCRAIISIMAGVKIKAFENAFSGVGVARVMPNTCALLGESASSVCFNSQITENDKNFVKQILLAIGNFVEIDESLMDEVIPLGGSFTAYAYLFMKAFIESAKLRGVDEQTAKTLVIQSMIGSAKMVEAYGDIDQLIKNVCSKGGTTLAGLEQLEKGGFEKLIDNCSVACANRSKELGGNVNDSK